MFWLNRSSSVTDGSRRRRWWRRLRHGEPRGGFLRSARSLGGQVIGRGIRRGHGLRSVGLHGADAVDRYIGGIAGLPGQRGRLSRLNGVRIHGNRSGWSRAVAAGVVAEAEPLSFRRRQASVERPVRRSAETTSCFVASLYSSLRPRRLASGVRRSVFTISNSSWVACCVR